jgi:phosphodiesterase/alkaline phosphatase D-like protein
MRFSIRLSAVAALVALVALAQTASAESPVSLPIGTPSVGDLGLQLPGAVTGDATVAGPSTATLTGTVDPNGQATNVQFEYGADESLNLTTPQEAVGTVGTGLDAAKVVTDILGLQPGTSYSYRVVAENSAGTSAGATHTLTTPTASASGVKARSRKTVCRVPRLRGKTVKAAKRAIRRRHCRLGTVKRKRAKSVRRGRVVSQSPKPGTRRAKGAKVKLTVRR